MCGCRGTEYFGKLCKEAYSRNAIGRLNPEEYPQISHYLYMTAVLALVVFEVVKVLVCLCFTVQL